MDLELEAAGGGGTRAVSLSVDSPTADLGRGDLGGGTSRDRTVSRRHVSLRLLGVGGGGVAFEVVGRNPVVVVRSPDGGDGGGSGTSRVFRRGEKGELRAGDALSLSLKAPAFWAVRARERHGDADADVEPAVLDAVARRERRTRERKERERERESERRAAEEAMEVTEVEEGGALDSDVEGFDIDLADIDPVRGELLFFISAFPGRVKIFHIPLQI